MGETPRPTFTGTSGPGFISQAGTGYKRLVLASDRVDFLTLEPACGILSNRFVRPFLAEQFQRVRFQVGLSEQKFVYILIALIHAPTEILRCSSLQTLRITSNLTAS